MQKLSLVVALAFVAFFSGSAFGQAAVPYAEEFENGVGAEWTETATGTVSSLNTFLGPFGAMKDAQGNNTPTGVSLSLTTAPRTFYILLFDLAVFDAWDRADDEFQVLLRNRPVFRRGFSSAGNNQVLDHNRMRLDRYEQLGYGPEKDIVLRDIMIPFWSWRGGETIEFRSKHGAGGSERGWAIDNVRVAAINGLTVGDPGLTVSWVDKVNSSARVEQIDFSAAQVQSYVSQVSWIPTEDALNSSVGVSGYAWKASGGLVVPETGSWRFRLTSTDRAQLKINSKTVFPGSAISGETSREVAVTLAAGTVPIEVRSMHRNGSAALVLEWLGPGDTHWSVVPPTAFKRLVPTEVPITDVTASSGIDNVTVRFAMMQGWNDLNNDGIPDLVLGGFPASLLNGTSSGTFVRGQHIPWLFYQLAMADADNDGDTDILSAFLGLFENNNGTYSPRGFPGLPIRYNYSIAAPDFDSDGRADIAALLNWSPLIAHNRRSDSTSVSYERSSMTKIFLSNRRWYFAHYIDADFNNDRSIDLFMSSGSAGAAIVLSGSGGYAFRPITAASRSWFSLFAHSTIADIDNDGDLDLFYGGDYIGRTNMVLYNDGQASFAEAPSVIPDTVDQRWSSATFGDVDNDGDLDLVICSLIGSRVELRLNNGDGSFAMGQHLDTAPRYPFDATLVDYDNDGDLDISIIGFTGMTLLRNDTDTTNYLKVRIIGSGDGATNVDGTGVRVELYDASTRQFIARRDVTSTNGNSAGPFWVHFGGVNPSVPYVVRVHFLSGVKNVTVVPSSVSTTIGSTTIAQMLTVEESSGRGRRVTQWKETDQRGTIRAALRAEARRRGLQKQVVALREANQLTIKNLLQLLGAKSVRDALGDDAAVLSDLNRDPRRGNGRHGSGRNGSRGNSRAGVDQP